MSDLVDFEDLAQLDGPDLRAVFGQVPGDDVLDALGGATPGILRMFLTKLQPSSAAKIQADLVARGPVGPLDARSAQRNLVEALCRLSRGSQVAFDDPDDLDMVA